MATPQAMTSVFLRQKDVKTKSRQVCKQAYGSGEILIPEGISVSFAITTIPSRT
jgi:hypothetical protein